MIRENKCSLLHPGEDDDTYMRRRLDEERQKIAETSCMVRSVHEEMLETYEERATAAAQEEAAMQALLARINDGDVVKTAR